MPITTPPEEDRATVIGNFVEDRTCSSEDMIADRQTHGHTDTLITILRSPIANPMDLWKFYECGWSF